MPIYPALSPAYPPPTEITPRDLPYTLLPLERFARIINYSPMLFHQVYVTELQDASSCSDPLLQYSWQPRGGGQPGRAEIAHAIKQAEDMIEQTARFSVRPRWVVDDAANVGRRWGGLGSVPYSFKVRAGLAYIIQGGREAWSLVDDDVEVVYSDRDGDGYYERATITVATSVEDANELEVYYPGTTHDPGWEIRPIRVTLGSGVATITFERHLAVLPERQEELGAIGVDGLVNGNFLPVVDVWRHYNDPSQMGIVEWQAGMCPPGCDVEVVNDVAAQAGYITPVDNRNSIVNLHAGTWDATLGAWTRTCPPWWTQPHRVRLWYRAGYRDMRLSRSMQEMSPELERAVTYLALAYLDREWTTCEQLRNVMTHWRADLASRDAGGSHQLSRGALDNPFGTSRAAVYAWNVVKRLQVGEAVLGN